MKKKQMVFLRNIINFESNKYYFDEIEQFINFHPSIFIDILIVIDL